MSHESAENTVEATITRSGQAWSVTVHGEQFLVFTNKRGSGELAIRDAIIDRIFRQTGDDDFELRLHFELPGEVANGWIQAEELRQQAEAWERVAAIFRRLSVFRLVAQEGYNHAEAAMVLNLSPQRVQQLASEARTLLDDDPEGLGFHWWLAIVDQKCLELAGRPSDGYSDFDYLQFFEDGKSPEEMAQIVTTEG